jgi:MraZ protein
VTGFLGRYEHQLDDKGRVALPASFRKGAEESRFVLLQWEADHLTLFPESTWVEVESRLKEFRRGGTAEKRFARRILANAHEVVPDKQGRILIPSWLQEAAGLEGSILLLGQSDQIDIWDPKRWDAAMSDEDEAAASDLADRIFL